MKPQTTKTFYEITISGSDHKGWRWEVIYPDQTRSSGPAVTFEDAQAKIKQAIDVGF